MNIIIDVSAAYTYLTNPKLKTYFWESFEVSECIMAPELFISEATNTAWKFHKIEERPFEECLELLSTALSIVESFIPTPKFHEQALRLACKFEHPAYDCFYLTIAQEYSGTIMTFDKKMIKLANNLGIPIITFS